MRHLTTEQANAAYSILIEHAGAPDTHTERESFVASMRRENPTTEYRFGGLLGSGGKFRNNGNRNNTPYVDCYPEDETPSRAAAIAATNTELFKLFAG